MFLDFDAIDSKQVYHLMAQTIIPRPVAWVLSDNGGQSYNLAPFSYFMGVCSKPPVMMISVGKKPNGAKKDTWVNIEERNHFVVHIAPSAMLREVHDSAAHLEHGESEVTKLGLDLVESPDFPLPRVRGPQAALFCERYTIHEVGDGPQALILGRIRGMWADEMVAEERGDGRVIISAKGIDPLARLGGQDYLRYGDEHRESVT